MKMPSLTDSGDVEGKYGLGKKLGSVVGGAFGAVAGGTVGSAVAPGPGTVAGKTLGTSVGKKVGEKVGLFVQKDISNGGVGMKRVAKMGLMGPGGFGLGITQEVMKAMKEEREEEEEIDMGM